MLSKGEITIDDTDIRKIKLENLRNNNWNCATGCVFVCGNGV